MTDQSEPACGAPDGHCITCSDEGIAMRVVRGTDESGVVWCVTDDDPGAGGQDVDAGLVDPVVPGDVLLVHAGVALMRLRAATEQPA